MNNIVKRYIAKGVALTTQDGRIKFEAEETIRRIDTIINMQKIVDTFIQEVIDSKED